jgi:hypothetical protein
MQLMRTTERKNGGLVKADPPFLFGVIETTHRLGSLVIATPWNSTRRDQGFFLGAPFAGAFAGRVGGGVAFAGVPALQ